MKSSRKNKAVSEYGFYLPETSDNFNENDVKLRNMLGSQSKHHVKYLNLPLKTSSCPPLGLRRAGCLRGVQYVAVKLGNCCIQLDG